MTNNPTKQREDLLRKWLADRKSVSQEDLLEYIKSLPENELDKVAKILTIEKTILEINREITNHD